MGVHCSFWLASFFLSSTCSLWIKHDTFEPLVHRTRPLCDGRGRHTSATQRGWPDPEVVPSCPNFKTSETFSTFPLSYYEQVLLIQVYAVDASHLRLFISCWVHSGRGCKPWVGGLGGTSSYDTGHGRFRAEEASLGWVRIKTRATAQHTSIL